MNKPARRTEWLVWGGMVLIMAGIVGAFIRSEFFDAGIPLPVIGTIPDFTLTNQDGRAVSPADFHGQVWIADIIFTRCPGPCATMTRHLAEVQAKLPADKPVRLVTLTSDPDFDTPAVLQKYGAHFKADFNRWSFLTGDKARIRALAVDNFKFVVVEKKPDEREVPDDLFIHSTWLALVDQRGQIRGWTDKTGSLHAYFESDDPAARGELLAAAKQLLRHPPL